MKRIFFGLLLFCLLASGAEEELTDNQKLYITAKVWGFLKYYHPQVNKGKINWDNQLLEILRKLPSIKTRQELSVLYLDWIASLGEVAPCKDCVPSKDVEYFDKNFDLSWLKDEVFTLELSDKLIYIEKNRSRKQYYVSRHGAQTLITNEPVYKSSQWNDENIRLLTLFKYWNTVEYFYPYKYQTDQKWSEVLKEMIPKFQKVKSEQEYHMVLHELTIKLCDSHAFFDTDLTRAFAGKKYISAKFKILNDKAVISGFYNDSLARLDDIRLGDAIAEVDNVPVSEIYLRNEKYINGSNPSVKKLQYAFRWIFNGDSDTVRITFERDGAVTTKTIRRYNRSAFKRESSEVVTWKRIDGAIGYANMEEITAKDLPKMMKDLADTRAIIFDARNYPEFIFNEIATFVNQEPQQAIRFLEPDFTYPGKFAWKEPVRYGKKNPKAYKGQVMILVNEETQSRAESLVMVLQTAKNAITIGRQTSGADGNIIDYTFFDKNTTWITGLGVFYPDGRETQRIGIVPDIKVELTLEDIRQGRDAILEKAIEIAKKK